MRKILVSVLSVLTVLATIPAPEIFAQDPRGVGALVSGATSGGTAVPVLVGADGALTISGSGGSTSICPSTLPCYVTVSAITAAATGPQTMANSDSVTIATNQTAIPISAAASTFAAQSYAVGAIPPAAGVLISGAVTTAMTATTSTSVVSATASNYQYITNCVTSNASTTVSTDILLQDGSGWNHAVCSSGSRGICGDNWRRWWFFHVPSSTESHYRG